MRSALLALLLVACSQAEETAVPAHPDLPGHNDCLPEGEAMDDDTCRAVLEEDGRLPTTPHRAAGTEAIESDPRLTDPEYAWMTAEVKRCTCVCCHTEHLGGPGSHRWDIEFEPVWIDSMNDWSIAVFTGQTDDYAQTLPTSDMPRLRAVLEAEVARRAGD